MYPRGGVCTVTAAYPTYGFAARKDITKVVSDGETNPTETNFVQLAIFFAHMFNVAENVSNNAVVNLK